MQILTDFVEMCLDETVLPDLSVHQHARPFEWEWLFNTLIKDYFVILAAVLISEVQKNRIGINRKFKTNQNTNVIVFCSWESVLRVNYIKMEFSLPKYS